MQKASDGQYCAAAATLILEMIVFILKRIQQTAAKKPQLQEERLMQSSEMFKLELAKELRTTFVCFL